MVSQELLDPEDVLMVPADSAKPWPQPHHPIEESKDCKPSRTEMCNISVVNPLVSNQLPEGRNDESHPPNYPEPPASHLLSIEDLEM